MTRRFGFTVVLVVVALLLASSCASLLAQPAAPRNVVLIGWDGCQRNHLKEMIAAGQVPNLVNLISQGGVVGIDVLRITDTKAGWAQILTGYKPELTGVFSNGDFRPIPVGYSIFERLESFFGPANIFTAAVIGKRNNLGTAPPNPTATPPFPGEPYYYTAQHMDLFANNLGAADNVGTAALRVLNTHGQGRFFLFVHFREPDEPGHQYGENSQQYTDAIAYDDVWLGRIVAKLEQLGVRDQTLIYVTADHGFDEGRRSHTDAPFVFLATDDPLVMRRGLREDIAPTIMWRFGMNLSTIRPRLTGHTLTLPYEEPIW